MGFISRLREACEQRQDGAGPGKTFVLKNDLKELLYHFDQLDKESRERHVIDKKEPCVLQLANIARGVCRTGRGMLFDGREYLAVTKAQVELLDTAQEKTFRVLGIRPEIDDYFTVEK